MQPTFHPVSDADKLFYYLFSEEESCSVLLEMTLCHTVNRESLLNALRRTLRRFPNFRRTPVLDGAGALFTTDNPQEVRIYPFDPEPVDFGTADTNGYLFRVMTEKDRVIISVFHAVCDGMGLFLFARTLLYYYFLAEGIPVDKRTDSILTLETPVDESEMADPFSLYPEVNADAKRAFRVENYDRVYRLPETARGKNRGEVHRKYRYVLDTEGLLQQAHAAETTLDAFFNLCVARTIHERYDTGGEVVTQLGAVDLRPFYRSRYLQNLRELYIVPYPASFFGLPEKEAAHRIRDGVMQAQLQKSHYDAVQYENKQGWHAMFDFPFADTAALKQLRDGLWADPGYHVTFFTTNLGRLDPDRVFGDLVRGAEISAPCIFPHPSFFVLTQGKETVVNLVQRHPDKTLPLLVREVFEKRGLLKSYRESDWFECDKLRVRRLPAVRG